MHLQLVLLGILVGSAWIVAACSGASRDASAQQVHPGSNASKAPNVTATEVNGNICAEVLSAWFSLSDIRINTPKDIRLGETKTVQLHFAQPISSGELVQRLAGRSESECLQSVQIALGNTMEARLEPVW
jgi:hypothetical protein